MNINKALKNFYKYVRKIAVCALRKMRAFHFGAKTRARLQRQKFDVGAKQLGDNSSVKPKLYNPNALPSESLKTHPSSNTSKSPDFSLPQMDSFPKPDAPNKVDTDAAITELIQALEHSNPYARRGAAAALGKIGTGAAIPGLIQALEDSDYFVRRNAAAALGKIGSDAAIPGCRYSWAHESPRRLQSLCA